MHAATWTAGTIKVNTIEFAGEKAVINSYGLDHPSLFASMNKQREEWTARFPNAIVRTEEMTFGACVDLVAAGRAKGDHLYSHCWAVGKASNGEAA